MTRVVIVDDDPALLRVLNMQFELEGYDVEAVGDGESALVAMQARPADAVILDVGLPGIDGLEVCSAIRRDPRLAAATVLVLTANDRLEEPSVAAGADGFVPKPYDLGVLSSSVRELLAMRVGA